MPEIRAARIHSYGGSEVVQVEEISLPEPQAGEILIRTHTAGVNPIDWKIRAGYVRQMITRPLPFTLGGDICGVVAAVGGDVNAFNVNDQVFGQAGVVMGGSGSFAQAAVANVGTIAIKPRNLGDLEAGALPLVGVSALQALQEHLQLSKGQKILIHGGAGGIGSIAIQMAKYMGAEIATTASDKDFDAISMRCSIPLAPTLTYRSFHVVRHGGRIVSMLEQPRQELMKERGVEAIHQFTRVTTERLEKLAQLAEADALKVNIDQTFALDETGKAFEYLEKASPRGKVVLKIG